jgi:hypothetical protein
MQEEIRLVSWKKLLSGLPGQEHAEYIGPAVLETRRAGRTLVFFRLPENVA